MSSVSPGIFSLNAGVVSRLSLARVDLARLKMAAEVQENLLPMVLGPCSMRPGTEYLGRTYSDNAPVFIPFIYNQDSKALVVITTDGVQFMINGVALARLAVSAVIANDHFTTDLAGWSNADESGAVSSWASSGMMKLVGTGTNYATQRQTVVVTETGVEHALRIVVAHGPVELLVGTTAGASDYISNLSLGTGEHSLAFTPTGNFYVTLRSNADVPRYVDSISVEAAGVVTLGSPWGSSLKSIRHAQSGDTNFIACDGVAQQRLEVGRADMRSWGIELYQPIDGPFEFPNSTKTTLTPSDVNGLITVTSSQDVFHVGHVGSIWRLTHPGQTAIATVGGDDQFTNYIRVTGLHEKPDTRSFTVSVVGTYVGTVTLEKSFGTPGAWVDVFPVLPSDGIFKYNDGLDNQIIYYRAGFMPGDYVSGSAVVSLVYTTSIQKGIVRVTEFTNTKTVLAEVISTLGKAEATTEWEEGSWSGVKGFPSSVAFHDGRLAWGKKDYLYLSVSDAFESFDDTIEGDSAPIVRSIATGPVDGVRWLLSIQRLLAGGSLQEISIRASGFDEPLTTTQFTARNFSTRGCANIQAVKVDNTGLFVQRNGKRVYILRFEYSVQDYISEDATRLMPEICAAGVVGMAVQRQPDTRVWFCLEDGTAAVLTYEPADEVVAWTTMTTTGNIKAIGVLPGDSDDEVYFAVERSPASGSIMAIERMATRDAARSGTLRKVMDSHLVFSGAPTTTFLIDHLRGLNVVAWGDGSPIPGVFTVNSLTGYVTLPNPVGDVVIGLGYDGRFKTAKLAYGAVAGTALSQQKRISMVSLIMNDVSWYGVRLGKSFEDMNRLAATSASGRALDPAETIDQYDLNATSFNGGWGSDERLHFKVSSPYGATFMAMIVSIDTNEPQTYGAQVTPGGSGG